MNKIFTLIAVALVGYNPIKAQNVKLGVRAGANISTLTNYNTSSIRFHNLKEVLETDEVTTGFKIGGAIGFFAEYHLSEKIAIEGGLAYSYHGASLKKNKYTSIDKTTGVITNEENVNFDKGSHIAFNQLNLPTWLKYNLTPALQAKVGVSLGYLLSIKTKIDKESHNPKPINRLDVGLGIGGEYNFSSGLFIDTNFTLGLTELKVENSNDYTSPSFESRIFQIGVGYKF
jgi:hypothetical protein